MGKSFSLKMPEYIRTFFDKYKYIILVCVVGVTLVMWPSGGSGGEPVHEEIIPGTAQLCIELENALTCIDGVGRVKVVLTLKSGYESVYAYDTKNAQSGKEVSGISQDSSSELVITSGGSTGQKPITVKVNMPRYQGVLVICEGGSRADVKLELTEAVSALTGLKSDNITILKMKN